MSSYSIDSDSPRWWWPSAVGGAAAAAAIAAILVVPAGASQSPGGTAPEAPAPPRGIGLSTIDPTAGRPCFALRAGQTASLEQPRCGQRVLEPWTGIDVRRPSLDARP